MTPPNPKPEESTVQKPVRRYLGLALLGLGVFLVVMPKSFSLAMFTSNSQSSVSIGAATDWTPPTVTMTDPGDGIRGTVTLGATAADAEVGIKNVAIAWAPSGTTTWTTLCTDTSNPYSCSFNTSGLPESEVDLRAIATDNSNYTAESIVEGVLVDNTAPTGSLNSIASPIAGVITISANASDAGSGVASVDIQRATAGGTTFTSICVDVETPYSCRFDSTQVSDGFYDFRAIVTDVAGNTTTTAKVTNRQVANTITNSVSVNDPGAYLRGTITLTANANATLGVASVRIQRQATGSSTWVDVCTDTSTPYSCTWDTTTVADGGYSFRAIMTPTIGTALTSAIVGPSQVDNTVVRGYDVQASNSGTLGKITAGDTTTLTYSRAMKLTSLLAGWDGAARAVTVRVRDGGALGLTGSDDTLDVFTTSSFTTAVNLGSVNLKGNYVKGGKTVGFNATMVAGTTTVNGVSVTTVTLTFGTQNSGQTASVRTASSTPVSMIWTPSALATDLFNNATSVAPTTEIGATKDRDL